MSTMNSAADMLAGMDMADFSAVADAVEVPGETDTGEVAEESAASEASSEIADQPDETVAPEIEEPEPEPEPVAAAEDLPEGVRRGKDRQGNEVMFVPPERWEEMNSTVQMNRQLAEMIGEPLTTEAINVRHRALFANEQMLNDMLSGDPKLQGEVLKFWQDKAAEARKEGFIGHDPMIPLAETMYTTLQKSSPDAYATLRSRAAKDLIQEMYQVAAEINGPDEESHTDATNLWRSASHIAKALGMKYRRSSEMEAAFSQPKDPSAALRAENEALKASQQSAAQQQRQAEINHFKAETSRSVKAAILNDAILPAIPKAVSDKWAKFPTLYQESVIAPIQNKVVEILKSDPEFNKSIGFLHQLAERAATPQARQQISDQISGAFANRAKLAADAVKIPILREANEKLQTENAQKHKRLQAAAQQRGPKGPQNGVPRSLIPANITKGSGGHATHASMMQDIADLFPN